MEQTCITCGQSLPIACHVNYGQVNKANTIS